jgi:hypothetical protein
MLIERVGYFSSFGCLVPCSVKSTYRLVKISKWWLKPGLKLVIHIVIENGNVANSHDEKTDIHVSTNSSRQQTVT